MIRMRASEFRLMLAVGICVVLFVANPLITDVVGQLL